VQVLLIRHPKPEIASGICYGSSDIPAQSEALSAAFAWLDPYLPEAAEIIASPLSRCAQLAAQLCLHGRRTLKLDARLAERCCGAWELQSWDCIPRAEIDAWATNFMDYAAPGAESVRQLQTRVLAAWESFQAQTESQTRVLLTHAGPIQVLLAHLTGAKLGAQPIVEIACGAAVLLTQASNKPKMGTCWQYRVVTP
jgi:alpha-ribazole phosphatase